MGHERSASAIRQMLDRQFGSDLMQEGVLDQLRVLYEQQPDHWDAALAGIEQPRVWVCVFLKPVCLKYSSFFIAAGLLAQDGHPRGPLRKAIHIHYTYPIYISFIFC